MRFAGTMLSLTLLAQSALAQDIPYAEPPFPQPGQTDALSFPSLGDIMVNTQLRHIKLWCSRRAGNWGLVKYELARIGDSLRKAALLYSNVPVEYIAGMSHPSSTRVPRQRRRTKPNSAAPTRHSRTLAMLVM